MINAKQRTTSSQRQRVSLCMIVRNEERNLPHCLHRAASFVDEMIVLDTGSTDRTIEVAREFGARVLGFVWGEDFAAARNESMRHASGDWILWLDADERLDEHNRQLLETLFCQLRNKNTSYMMIQESPWNGASNSSLLVSQVRLFPKHPEVRWQGRVHEQVLPSLQRLRAHVQSTEIVIHHTGYQDPELLQQKKERNLRLLHLEDKEHPDNPLTLFYLGWNYQESGRFAEALPFVQRSLHKSPPGSPLLPKLYALLSQIHGKLGEVDRAQAACKNGRERFPDDPELLFLEGQLLTLRGEFLRAEGAFLRGLNTKPANHFIGLDPIPLACETRQWLALLYQQQGRDLEATAHWQDVVRERPKFTIAQIGLSASCRQLKLIRESQRQGTACRNSQEKDLENETLSKQNRTSIYGLNGLATASGEESSQKEWVIRLPKITRRWATLLGFAAIGVLSGILVLPQSTSTSVTFTAIFLAVLSGFCALWSP